MTGLRGRLARLSSRLGIEGQGYAIPETVDVRDLTPAQRAQAIAEAEERTQGKQFAGVSIVIIDRCEPR